MTAQPSTVADISPDHPLLPIAENLLSSFDLPEEDGLLGIVAPHIDGDWATGTENPHDRLLEVTFLVWAFAYCGEQGWDKAQSSLDEDLCELVRNGRFHPADAPRVLEDLGGYQQSLALTNSSLPPEALVDTDALYGLDLLDASDFTATRLRELIAAFRRAAGVEPVDGYLRDHYLEGAESLEAMLRQLEAES